MHEYPAVRISAVVQECLLISLKSLTKRGLEKKVCSRVFVFSIMVLLIVVSRLQFNAFYTVHSFLSGPITVRTV